MTIPIPPNHCSRLLKNKIESLRKDAKIEYYDLESKAVGRTNLGWPSEKDMETLWAQVVFTF